MIQPRDSSNVFSFEPRASVYVGTPVHEGSFIRRRLLTLMGGKNRARRRSLMDFEATPQTHFESNSHFQRKVCFVRPFLQLKAKNTAERLKPSLKSVFSIKSQVFF